MGKNKALVYQLVSEKMNFKLLQKLKSLNHCA